MPTLQDGQTDGMNQRTKMLAIALGAMLGAAGLWQLLYPVFIEPLTTLDQRLASRGDALADLEDLEKASKKAAEDYRALASRIGSFDMDRLTAQVRDRINTLIDKHKLVADSVSPSRPLEDRKTKVSTTTINVKAVGRLESVIGFLKDVSELPQLSRVGNVAIYPTSSNPGTKEAARVNVRVPIEIKVLPQQKLAGVIQEKDLQPPDAMVRNQGREYSALWTSRPFFDYVPPAPLVAVAGRDVPAQEGQDAALRGSATGGEQPYSFLWSGEAIIDPSGPSVVVNTKGFTPGDHVYNMTVTDAAGASATSTVKITIKAPIAAPVAQTRRPDPPPPPAPDPRWPGRGLMEVVMMVGRSDVAETIDELMVQNKADGVLRYLKAGDEFDGGRLMFVHQTGGLVRRKDLSHPTEEKCYVYPIGVPLDQDLPVDDAGEFPELQAAARKLSATLPVPAPKVESPGADAGGAAPAIGSGDAVTTGVGPTGSADPDATGAVPTDAIPTGGDDLARPATALGSEVGGAAEGAQPVGANRGGSGGRQTPSPPTGARKPARRPKPPKAP